MIIKGKIHIDKIVPFFFAVSLATTNFELVGFYVIDLILIFLALLIIASRKFVLPQKINIPLFLFYFVPIIILPVYIENEYFVLTSFTRNLIRLVLYPISISLILVYLKNKNLVEKSLKLMIKFAMGISYLAIFEFCMKLIGLGISFQIPGLTQRIQTRSASLLRSYTFFNEPSHLAFYLCGTVLILLLYEYFVGKKIVSRKNLVPVSILLGILVTFSFGNIILLIPIYFFGVNNLSHLFSFKLRPNKKTILTAILTLFSFAYLYINFISTRLDKIIRGEDLSSNHRILGSYEIFEYFNSRIGLFGAGFGQKMNFISYDTGFGGTSNYYFTGDYTGINNTLLEVFMSSGYFGLVCFIIIMYLSSRKSKYIFFYLILCTFNGSHLNNAFFWIILIFSTYFTTIYESQRNSKKHQSIITSNSLVS